MQKIFQNKRSMAEVKLNLGCGKDYRKDFINVDSDKPADVLHNLNTFPYPFKENSVDFIFASHIVEHLKDPELALKEMNRILKKGGILEIKVPHYKSKGAYCTFGHRGFYHEEAINSITNIKDESNDLPKFKHIITKIKRGRFLKWQKREITWIVQKV